MTTMQNNKTSFTLTLSDVDLRLSQWDLENDTRDIRSIRDNEDILSCILCQSSGLRLEEIQHLLQSGPEDPLRLFSLFCEMDVLCKLGDFYLWRETARWVKYEEFIEEGGMRWSKPHVSALSLPSLFELRNSLASGLCLLNMDATSMKQLADIVIENLETQQTLENSVRDQIHQAISAQHCFQHQKTHRILSTIPSSEGKNTVKKNTSVKFVVGDDPTNENDEVLIDHSIPVYSPKSVLNENFMKKIPSRTEAASILVGELACLKDRVVHAFIRLCEGRNVGEITEVPIPTRFIIILLGPPGSQMKNVEIGRAMSTIMVDKIFRRIAYKATSRHDILIGIDYFLSNLTALPPDVWDPKIRLEPPQIKVSKKVKNPDVGQIKAAGEESDEEDDHFDPTLVQSGRLFGGLIADVKRKLIFYASDFKDSLHIQCVASIIFMYLVTLAPNVTFGGLLGLATDQCMGTMECILAASICGILFSLFSGQPLNILGSTAPMLVLETILYNFCVSYDLDFLPFRAWIGLWTTAILLIIVAFDLSFLVKYITRFTEECFASLIAIIFIAEAFTKLIGILKEAPVNLDPTGVLNYTCQCFPPNTTEVWLNMTEINIGTFKDTLLNYVTGFNVSEIIFTGVNSSGVNFNEAFNSNISGNSTYLNTSSINWTAISVAKCSNMGGVPITVGCNTLHYVSDAFFLSVLLFLGTFLIASTLAHAKTSPFFPTCVRQTLSDFAVLLAIISMVAVDIIIGLPTPKLYVPSEFKPTRDRSWFVNPISDKNPFWLVFAAVLPAMLSVILIFMDQQITAVIVNRKENKLVKGSGYHLDMFVVAICIAVCSLLGLPWYVAATVSALAHIMSLRKESECTAPGERPTFLGVREQRVTALTVGILTGVSVLLTSVLQIIPMAVLYGVFFFMGVAALKGMQFINRILLFFKPAKYQPDYIYLRHVPIKRVHLFTIIQLICLAILWVIKTVDAVSIIFPIMILGTCFVRKALDYLFTQNELKLLDDLMPETVKKEKEDKKKKLAEIAAREEDVVDILITDVNNDNVVEIQIERVGDNTVIHRSMSSCSMRTQHSIANGKIQKPVNTDSDDEELIDNSQKGAHTPLLASHSVGHSIHNTDEQKDNV
ncbi:unnamed protein product [Lymnaea stagnalis]|uniref:Anion exchange protein n=1 Tax=Lymnaea stagnalis TaxID=6523 RepID=A0AAV2IKK9_LYMST